MPIDYKKLFKKFFQLNQLGDIKLNVNTIVQNENALLYYLRNIDKIGLDNNLLSYLINNSDLKYKNIENKTALDVIILLNENLQITEKDMDLLLKNSISPKTFLRIWLNQDKKEINIKNEQWFDLIEQTELKPQFFEQKEMLTLFAVIIINMEAKNFNENHLIRLYERTKEFYNIEEEYNKVTIAAPQKRRLGESVKKIQILYSYNEINNNISLNSNKGANNKVKI